MKTMKVVEVLSSVAFFIRLRRRPRIHAGRNAIFIYFGVMSPFTPGG
jgi:hypothetical protein